MLLESYDKPISWSISVVPKFEYHKLKSKALIVTVAKLSTRKCEANLQGISDLHSPSFSVAITCESRKTRSLLSKTADAR
jgi:hypothetical protein